MVSADLLAAAAKHGRRQPIGAPIAVLDLGALDANASDLRRRAGGLPLRIATKSVRCRWVLEHLAARRELDATRLMSFSLTESLWLARAGHKDVLLAYPTADRKALAELVADPLLRERVTIMVDHPDHLRLITAAGADADHSVQVCLDVDASLRLGPAHLGVRRSPVRTARQAASAAGRIAATPGTRLRGIMMYDAQVAGLPDASPAVRAVKSLSVSELQRRRAAVLDAVTAATGHPLELFNVGGTGSVHRYHGDATATEVAAGSGLYGPTLFDGYRDFRPRPALFIVSPVVRRPAHDVATVFSAGFIASGPPGTSRVPLPVHPSGLRLLGTEGAGEVQTPVRGSTASQLAVGDLVWFRPAKAGEQLERVSELLVVAGGAVVATVPTYRGEGKTWG